MNVTFALKKNEINKKEIVGNDKQTNIRAKKGKRCVQIYGRMIITWCKNN